PPERAVEPPKWAAFSTIIVLRPRWAAARAATMPAPPLPTTTTSNSEIISPKSPHSFDRGSSARPRQFYNVFYMTAQEFDVVVVGSGGAGMVGALAGAPRGLSAI